MAPLAARKLIKAVKAQNYILKFDRLSLNVYTGTASLEQVQLAPDAHIQYTAASVGGSAPKIEFSGIRVMTLLF